MARSRSIARRRQALVPDAPNRSRNSPRPRRAPDGVGGEIVHARVVVGEAERGRSPARARILLEQVIDEGGAAADGHRSSGWPVRVPCGRRSGSGAHRAQACFGSWAWQIDGPWVMRLTCASCIWSGSSIARNMSCACSAVAFGGISPMRLRDPLDVPVHRHQRHPEPEQQHDRRGLAADARDRGQPGARLRAGISPRNSSE